MKLLVKLVDIRELIDAYLRTLLIVIGNCVKERYYYIVLALTQGRELYKCGLWI